MKHFVLLITVLCASVICNARTDNPASPLHSGYAGTVSVGGGVILNKGIGDRMLELETCHGKNYGNGAFFGAGLGMQELVHDLSGNIFSEFRYTFDDGKIYPFVTSRGGWSFGDLEGAFARIGGGVNVGKFNMTLYYRIQSGDSYRLHSLGISTGISF